MQFSSGLLGMLTLDTSRHVGQLSGAGLKRAAVRLRAKSVALAAGGPRLFEEVKADRAREAFDERRRALDELGVDITHLVILVPDGSGRGGWRRCRADDSDLCRRVRSG